MILWRKRAGSGSTGIAALVGIGMLAWLFQSAAFAQDAPQSAVPDSGEAAAAPDAEDAAFASWVAGVKDEAVARGLQPAIVEAALGNVKRIVRAISRDKNQPEFKQTYDNYLKQRVSPWRIDKGRRMRAEHAATFEAVGRSFGIQPRFVGAIWGLETNFGTIELSYSAFDVLATLGHEGRRETFFKNQIFAALQILQQGDATLDLMKSSWAGAMGQPQFMPAMYLEYAQDFDGDGDKDIWTSPPDVMASIARLLTAVEWFDDETWGRPVIVPDNIPASSVLGAAPAAGDLEPSKGCKRFSKSLGPWRPLSAWQSAGVRRLNGDDLPARDIPAALIPPEDGGNKGYIVYRNFCSIMWYNPSFKYALSVGLLANQIK